MEPFFLICLECHNARPWQHRSDHLDCPNGCDGNQSIPWFDGFGPDEKPVARHPSGLYGDGADIWPDSTDPAVHINNMAEMRELCK